MANDNHNVIIISSHGDLKIGINNKINFLNVDFKRDKNLFFQIYYYFYAIFLNFKIIKSEKVDIIFNHHRYLSPIYFLAKLFFKIKVIYVAHATSPKNLFLDSYLFGDKIWAVSKMVRDHFVNEFKIDINNIKIINNTVNKLVEYQAKKNNLLKEKLNLSGKKIITCVAHYRKLKRQDFLIDAFILLARKNKNVNLILYGFGETEFELKSKALKSNFAEKILFIKDEYSVESIINITDIMVLPSQREGLPLSLLEGLSLGKPLIGTRGTGMEEIISHEYNGYLFDSDSITSLTHFLNLSLKNKDNYDRLSNNARFTFETKFNPKKYKFSLLALLKNELKTLL